MFAMTSIKGCGRRFSNIVCKKADVDMTKRAGELTEEEVERIVTSMNNPRQYKIPDWFLNRQKDIKDGKFSQVLVNIRRRPDDVAALLVSPRRREANFQLKSTFSEKRNV